MGTDNSPQEFTAYPEKLPQKPVHDVSAMGSTPTKGLSGKAQYEPQP